MCVCVRVRERESWGEIKIVQYVNEEVNINKQNESMKQINRYIIDLTAKQRINDTKTSLTKWNSLLASKCLASS